MKRWRVRSAITPYYNSPAHFPVLTIEPICMRRDAFYHGGYMGRSPWDEPSVLAMSLNEMFVPMLQRTFPEIVDFYLPQPASLDPRQGIPA